MTLPEYVYQLRECYLAHANEFEDIFGRRLREFWDNRTGFDVVKFDVDFIKAADNESCRDAVVDRYGERAARLIEKLINNEK